MKIWRGIDQTPTDWGRSVVTVGVFDGVHRGHQRVISQAVSVAAQRGIQLVVVTFDPHPVEVIRPGSHPPVLTPVGRKTALLRELGVDAVCVLPFTVELSQRSPEEFTHEVLVSALHAAVVVIGENFQFGHRAAGDVETLRRLGERFGFSVQGCSLERRSAEATEQPIYSSTYIRACVAAGDVSSAAAALGRPHRIEGLVVRGDRRGTTMGFPTANLAPPAYTALPADGIYAGWLRRARSTERVPAAISVGSNPTFAGQTHRVEAYLLDFSEDLYGEQVTIDFVDWLRPMVRFDTPERLVEAMTDDVANTRRILTGDAC
ncbi:MAG: bifunctional riboflavin kinase/FAD synthetase [Mycobacteriales bacterium]